MSASTYGFNGNNPFVSIYSVDNNGNLQSPAETRPVSLNGNGPFTVNCPAVFTKNIEVSTINGVAYGESGVPGEPQDLYTTLTIGNNAQNQSITNVNDLQCATINGNPVPVSSPPQNLAETLYIDNNAQNQSITNVNNLQCATINGNPVPVSSPPQNWAETLYIDNNAAGLSITNLNNLQVVSINGLAYPPASSENSTLQQVLSAGQDGGGLKAINLAIDCNSLTVAGQAYPVNSTPGYSSIGGTISFLALSGNYPNQSVPTVFDYTLPSGIYIVNAVIVVRSNVGLSYLKTMIKYKGITVGFSIVSNTTNSEGPTTIAFIQSDGSANVTVVLDCATADNSSPMTVATNSYVGLVRLF